MAQAAATSGERSVNISPADMLAKVGHEIGVSEWITVDQDMINAFADTTLDHQFIHIDPERAKAETPFGGTIAHGFLVLSLMAKMSYDAVPGIIGTTMGVNYGFEKLRFITPVRSGARVRGRFILAEAEERAPGELTLKYNVAVEIEGAHKPAIAAEWLTRVYFGDEQ